MLDATLEGLLLRYRSELLGFLGREAGGALLRCESAEDLLQGVATRILESAGDFELRTEAEARAWLYRVARNHLADRVRYWTALKRRSGPVLRFEISRSGAGAWDPAASQTSPSQFAVRREQLILAAKALDLLMDRDRDLVEWTAAGLPLADQAERLGVGYAAVAQASRRAQERFRRVYAMVRGGAAPLPE